MLGSESDSTSTLGKKCELKSSNISRVVHVEPEATSVNNTGVAIEIGPGPNVQDSPKPLSSIVRVFGSCCTNLVS
jgi:hypothetical protein